MFDSPIFCESVVISEVSKIRSQKVIEVDVVKRLFMEGQGKLPKAESVASELCLSVRTFNRYLKNSGASFRELQGEVRKNQASYYLLETSEPIKSIAEKMGYANPSNFTKAFKVWFGVTPKDFRSDDTKVNRVS